MAALETQSVQDAPLKMLGGVFWQWFRDHSTDTWPIKLWFINIRVQVRDLKGLFERIFGPE